MSNDYDNLEKLPRLPNPHQAVVDIDKLHDYCLSRRRVV